MLLMMHARYRYRIESTGAQRAMLARTFGCVRVVFNDATRETTWQAGETLPKTEVQCRVITEASGLVLDRDVNAALNIVAAGCAER